jgi:hypothetical protein
MLYTPCHEKKYWTVPVPVDVKYKNQFTFTFTVQNERQWSNEILFIGQENAAVQWSLYKVTRGIFCAIQLQSSTFPLHTLTQLTHSKQQLQRILNHLLKLTDPVAANGTIHDLMIKARRDDDLVIPLYRRSVFCLSGDSDLLCCADGQDPGLGWVDDGCKAVDGWVHAHVADGEGSTLVFFWLELAVSCALAEIFNLCGDRFETETFDIFDDGGHETSWCCNGDLGVVC